MGKQHYDERIVRLATIIAALENEISLGRNVQNNMSKIQSICAHLSLDDMVQIDDYIITKQKINKKGENTL